MFIIAGSKAIDIIGARFAAFGFAFAGEQALLVVIAFAVLGDFKAIGTASDQIVALAFRGFECFGVAAGRGSRVFAAAVGAAQRYGGQYQRSGCE